MSEFGAAIFCVFCIVGCIVAGIFIGHPNDGAVGQRCGYQNACTDVRDECRLAYEIKTGDPAIWLCLPITDTTAN